MTNTKTIPQITNAKSAKKFFSSRIGMQSRYSAGDIVNVLRNAITMNEYVETYVRNKPSSIRSWHFHARTLYCITDF